MELPYYMTPLVGALAWGVLLGPKTGLVNQVWRSTGAPGDLFDIYSPCGIAWVMALFEGTVAFVMISASMKSMDPSLEESSRVLGAGKLRTALRITLPLVVPGVLSATHLRVRRDARLVRRRLRARHSGPLLRRHHGDLAGHAVVPARLRPRRGDGAVAVRRHAGHADPSAAGAAPRQLRHHHRQGVPPARDGRRPHALAAARHCLGLHHRRRGPAARRAAAHLVRALRHGDPAADAVHPGQLRDRAADRARSGRRSSTA